MSSHKAATLDETSTLETSWDGLRATAAQGSRTVPALVIAWARGQPHRLGEVVLIGRTQILGRGSARTEDGLPRARFEQQRPGRSIPTPALDSVRVSRSQLRLTPLGDTLRDTLRIESIGLCPLLVNGERVTSAEVTAGDTVQLHRELVFLVTRRPEWMPALHNLQSQPETAFGAADPFGLVGESPAAWALRDALAFAARAEGHVLIHGESGTGKELCAAAIHRLSSRGDRPLVSRNAATFPAGLVDAELFGNARNYPNPGSAEREGLIGEADGTTLFLDEIGELPAAEQAHLLRVLDQHGEYHRLGEARVRRADLRAVAATNRALTELKHDLAARFTLQVAVPPLAARGEDVPLLIRHLLARAAAGNPDVRRRFCSGDAVEPRVDAALVERLLRHRFRTNTRELAQLLWQALADSRGDTVELTDSVVARLADAPPGPARRREPDRAAIESALAATHGNVTRAAQTLGLRNRFALYRWMKKLGVSACD